MAAAAEARMDAASRESSRLREEAKAMQARLEEMDKAMARQEEDAAARVSAARQAAAAAESALAEAQAQAANAERGANAERAGRGGGREPLRQQQSVRIGRDGGLRVRKEGMAGGDADGARDASAHHERGGSMPQAAMRAIRSAQERADAAEDLTKGLQERLTQAEHSVKMLRQQLYRETHGNGGGTRSASASAAVRPKQMPGRRYAPTKLPTLAVNDENGGNMAAQLADVAEEAPPPLPIKRLKPQWDPCPNDVDTSAFPNYGGKSRSGLKVKPKTVGPIEA